MQDLNPVRGVTSDNQELRARVINALYEGEHDTVTSLADEVDGTRSTVSRIVNAMRSEEYVDELQLTHRGITQVGRVKRALVEDIVTGLRRQADAEPDVSDVEDVVNAWVAGIDIRSEAADIETEPHEAIKWFTSVIGQPLDGFIDMESHQKESLDADVAEWLIEREMPFYPSDCPYSPPSELIVEMGGDLLGVVDDVEEVIEREYRVVADA